MPASALTSHRPRLECEHDGTAPVPNFHPRGARPTPVEPQPLTPRDALRARLDAARQESLAAFRAPPQGRFVTRNEIVAINADLASVVAINALPHHYRSDRVAAWPSPVFRESVIHSWRDLHASLAAAALVLAAADAHDNTWFACHA